MTKAHTIIFDFDDTIVNSHDIQVDAWLDLIENALQKHKEHMNLDKLTGSESKDEQKKILNDNENLKTHVRKIFFEQQLAPQIFDVIFSRYLG